MTVIVLADGTLGQMMEPVVIEEKPHRQLPAKDWALTGASGRKQNIVKSLYLPPEQLCQQNQKLQTTYQQIENIEVLYEQYKTEDADVVLIAYGVAARVVRSVVTKARAEGIKAGLIRPVTLWPFPKKQLNSLADQFRIFLAVELSTGQMVEDVKLAVAGKAPVLFYGQAGGIIPTVEEILKVIKQTTSQKDELSQKDWRSCDIEKINVLS